MKRYAGRSSFARYGVKGHELSTLSVYRGGRRL